MKNIMILNLGKEFGGTEKYILNILENINFNKYNIHICTRKDSKFSKKLKEIENENINLLELEFSKKHILNAIKILKKYINKCNIKVIHSNGITSDLISNLCRKKNGNIKIISTVHGFSNFDRMNRSYVERKTFEILEKILFKYNDYYIAVSNSIKNYLINKGLNESKINLIYHSIKINDENTYTCLNTNDKEFIIGSVGRLEEVKGYDILINAVKLLKDDGYIIKCILVGEGKEKIYLEKLSLELGVRDNIVFEGFKNNVDFEIKKMDIYIQPSRQESFGISILEAMNNCKPIVATRVGGIVEIIDDEVNGILFELEDKYGLYRKIKGIIENPLQAEKLAIEGKSKLVKDFSINKFISKLEEIYDKA